MKIGALKKSARDSLKGNWGIAIGATVLAGVIGVIIGWVSRPGDFFYQR